MSRALKPIRIGIDLGGTKIEILALDQDGNEKVKAGEVMSLGDLAVIDWFVKGVESAA